MVKAILLFIKALTISTAITTTVIVSIVVLMRSKVKMAEAMSLKLN